MELSSLIINVVSNIQGAINGFKRLEQTSRTTAKRIDKNLNEIKTTGLEKSLFNIRNAFAAFGGVMIGSDLIDTAVNFEAVRMSFEGMTGSVEKANKALEIVKETAKETGVNLLSGAKDFRLLYGAAQGAGYSMDKLEDLFKASSKAALVLGLRTEDTSGIMRAFGQMMSKGTVQAEELKGQLGDRLPGALGMAAEAMGMTNREILKAMETASLKTSDFIDKFTKKLNDTYDPAVVKMRDSTTYALKQMDNAFLELKDNLGQSGLLEVVADIAKAVADFVGSISRADLQNFFSQFSPIVDAAKILRDVFVEIKNVLSGFGVTLSDVIKAVLAYIVVTKTGIISNLNFASSANKSKRALGGLGSALDTVKLFFASSTNAALGAAGALKKVKLATVSLVSSFVPLAAAYGVITILENIGSASRKSFKEIRDGVKNLDLKVAEVQLKNIKIAMNKLDQSDFGDMQKWKQLNLEKIAILGRIKDLKEIAEKSANIDRTIQKDKEIYALAKAKEILDNRHILTLSKKEQEYKKLYKSYQTERTALVNAMKEAGTNTFSLKAQSDALAQFDKDWKKIINENQTKYSTSSVRSFKSFLTDSLSSVDSDFNNVISSIEKSEALNNLKIKFDEVFKLANTDEIKNQLTNEYTIAVDKINEKFKDSTTKAQNILKGRYDTFLNGKNLKDKAYYTNRLLEERKWVVSVLGNTEEVRNAYANALEQIELKHNDTFESGMTQAIQEYGNKVKGIADATKSVFTTAFNSLENSLVNFIDITSDKFMDFKELALDITTQIYQAMIRAMIVQPLVNAAVSSFGSVGSSNTVDPNTGTVTYSNPQTFDVPTRASGGAVSAGQPYVIGEQRPELFIPNVGGRVVPRASTSSSVTVNITNETGSDITEDLISEFTKTNSRGEEEKVINIVLKNLNTNSSFRSAIAGAK